MSWPVPGVPIPASRVNTDILATEQNKGVSMARIYIPVGSVTGTALAVAQAVSQQLETEGHQTRVDEDAAVEQLQDWDVVLVCTSTTGRGDVPGNLLPFYQQLQQAKALTASRSGLFHWATVRMILPFVAPVNASNNNCWHFRRCNWCHG